jgi:hypothetical protein
VDVVLVEVMSVVTGLMSRNAKQNDSGLLSR